MKISESFKQLIETLYSSSHANIRDEFSHRLATICVNGNVDGETYLQLISLCIDLVNASYRRGIDDILSAVRFDMNSLQEMIKKEKGDIT